MIRMKQGIHKAVRLFSITALVLVPFLWSGSAVAQNSTLAEEAAYRAEIIELIVDKWQNTNEAASSRRWPQGITTWLQRLGTDELLAALDVASYEELTAMLSASTGDRSSIVGLDIPLAASQLYYSLDPCRLVDTRYATGQYTGPIGHLGTASYHAKNSAEIVNQGGMSGGCSVPPGATALVINITSTQQGGSGHLRAYPYGSPLPNASIVNFSGSDIANATILPICEGTCSYDFSIYSHSSSHVIVDVMGYFAN